MKHVYFLTAASLVLTSCSQITSDTPTETPTQTQAATVQAATPAKTPTSSMESGDEARIETPDISRESLRDGIHILTGPGGNVGVSVGEDGVFVIDDKFDRFADQILTQISQISDEPVTFVINTHYHGDHTGANGAMKDVGATIVAHDNVRARMGTSFDNRIFGREVKATDAKQWPTLTFSDKATFHFNEQTVKITHVPSAHTDGDSIIQFKEANIIHMGDNFFNGTFPYVDVDSGGSLDGMIAAHDLALSMSDADTIIIPGHGPLATPADLKATQDMLKDIRALVQAQIDAGQTLETMDAEALFSNYSDKAGFIDSDKMLMIAYFSLTE